MKVGDTFSINFQGRDGSIGSLVLSRSAKLCLVIDVQKYDDAIHGGCSIDYKGTTRIMEYTKFGEPYIRYGVALGAANTPRVQCYQLLCGDDLMWVIKSEDVDTLYWHELIGW